MSLVSRTTMLMIVVFIVAITVSIITYMPTSTTFSPYNTYGDGLSVFVDKLGIKTCMASSSYKDYRVLVVLAGKPFDEEKMGFYRDFLARGGTLIVFDDKGFVNKFLAELGVGITVVNNTVLDEVFKYGDRFHVKAYYNLSGSSGFVVLYKPGFIRVEKGVKADVIVFSSRYSYIDVDSNGYYSIGEPMGRQYIGARTPYGDGMLVVIADRELVTNNLVGEADNMLFLSRLLNNAGNACLDLSELKLEPMDYVKYYLSSYTQPFRSDLVLALFLLAVTGVGFIVKKKIS